MQHEGREKSQPGKERRGREEERVVFMPLLHPILGIEITVLSTVNDSVHSRGILLCRDLSLGNRLTGC